MGDKTEYRDMSEELQLLIKETLPYQLDTVMKKPVIQGEEMPGNITGLFDWRKPETLKINSAPRGAYTASLGTPHVAVHELEHALQEKVSNRSAKNWDSQVIDEFIKQSPTNTIKQFVNILRNGFSDPELYDYLKASGMSPAMYMGQGEPGDYHLREQFSELSALEQYHKKDLTKDPVIRRRFFGDNEDMIRVYKATTGLRTERLDAKDLPPMTAERVSVTEKVKSRARELLPNWIMNAFQKD